MLSKADFFGALRPRDVPWHPQRLLLGWLMIVVILLLSLWPSVPMPNLGISWTDKLGHFVAYLLLMGWFGLLYQRQSHIALALRLILLGVLIEILQWLSGYRFFELADIAANTAGVLTAAMALGLLPDGASSQ